MTFGLKGPIIYIIVRITVTMKYLVLGDIHNEYKLFMDAVLFAKDGRVSWRKMTY